MSEKVCAIVGAGPGNGVAFARRFAATGYRVALLARDLDRLEALAAGVPGAAAFRCDAGDPGSIRSALAAVRDALGPVDVLLYNADAAPWGEMSEITAEGLERGWRVAVLGLFVAAGIVAEDMVARGSGVILVTGATASLRGNVRTIAFASGKAGQRSLAQSLAKTLGPKGVHVACMIIDGVIDTPQTRAMFGGEKPDEFYLTAEGIAEAAWFVAHQDRSAWTFEFDLRPFGERW